MKRLVVVSIAVAWAGIACNRPHNGFPRAHADRIKFSHARHAEAEVECATCHEDVYEATDLSVDLRPKESVCLDCHQERKDAGECSFCHTDPAAPASYAPYRSDLRINHEKHLLINDENCAQCHTELPEPGRAPGGTTEMANCTGCHHHEVEVTAGTCDTCHVDLARASLRPLVTDFSHTADYIRAHGPEAITSPSTCGQCHDQPFCTDCHAGTVATTIERIQGDRLDRAFIHRGDYLSRHAVDASVMGDTCLSCHAPTSCTTCHEMYGVTEKARNPHSPHPPGWVTAFGRSGHGRAARVDIAMCAACHDQGAASICVDCHRVGGIGPSPHPIGWSANHSMAEVSRNGMCTYCH